MFREIDNRAPRSKLSYGTPNHDPLFSWSRTDFKHFQKGYITERNIFIKKLKKKSIKSNRNRGIKRNDGNNNENKNTASIRCGNTLNQIG